MKRYGRFLSRCLGVWFGLIGLGACAQACTVAFDMGSSGIRAAAQAQDKPLRLDLNALALLSAPQDHDRIAQAIGQALQTLLAQGAFANCQSVAGGFSVWRMAEQQDRPALIRILRTVWERTGVPIYIIPQAREGHYGHIGLSAAWGPRLQTPYVLDFGGGSLQLASAQQVLGLPLGQRNWYTTLCRALFQTPNCELHGLSPAQLAQARETAATALQAWPAQPGTAMDLSSASRPITQGIAHVLPIHRSQDPLALPYLTLSDLSEQIEQRGLSRLTPQTEAAATPAPTGHQVFLLSDMLLTEAILHKTGASKLYFAEADLSNVPGLLADTDLMQWQSHYGCYLHRLAQQGPTAMETPANSCD